MLHFRGVATACSKQRDTLSEGLSFIARTDCMTQIERYPAPPEATGVIEAE